MQNLDRQVNASRSWLIKQDWRVAGAVLTMQLQLLLNSLEKGWEVNAALPLAAAPLTTHLHCEPFSSYPNPLGFCDAYQSPRSLPIPDSRLIRRSIHCQVGELTVAVGRGQPYPPIGRRVGSHIAFQDHLSIDGASDGIVRRLLHLQVEPPR